MNAFRLTTLTDGNIDIHGRVSQKDIKPDLLLASQEVLRRLRAGEESVPFPSDANCMFDVRLGFPASIKKCISARMCSGAEYEANYFHLTIEGGTPYVFCLLLGDEDDDAHAADLAVPVFLASIPGYMPSKKHTHRTAWNVAINRPVLAVASIVPVEEDCEARMRLSEEFCSHMAAAMLEARMSDMSDVKADEDCGESDHSQFEV